MRDAKREMKKLTLIRDSSSVFVTFLELKQFF